MTAAFRLNARIDADLAARVKKVQQRTGKSMTEVIHDALNKYCLDSSETQPLGALLHEVGLTGCVEGPSDLSTTYKKRLSSSLSVKTSNKRR